MIDEFVYPTPESKLITFQIGAVCINWAQIDSYLGFILGKYMKAPSAHADIATSIVEMSRKCELIKAFSVVADERKTYERLEKALNFLDNDLRPVRNRYVHDNYSFFTGNHIRKVFKTQVVKSQAFRRELVTRHEGVVTADEINAFNTDLNDIAMFLVGHLIMMIVDPKKAEPNAMDSLMRVHEEGWTKLLETIKRHRSNTKVTGRSSAT